jgi:glycosyltransferase involved in cell wall biosynthesis
MDPTDAPPTISVGLAIRNEPHSVRRCIESVLAQDFTDLELVICDNASDDETVETLQDYARQDSRVIVAVNPVNIGLHENFNRVLELSRGTLFRWISADDWLEPSALSAGVEALERYPNAVGVTSGFTIHTPGAAPRFERYQGEFPSSHDPARRFERMLWFLHARNGQAKYDPIYGIYRREKLMRSGRARPNECSDWLLSAELALLGPILHIDELLAHRTCTYPVGVDRAAVRRRLDPVRGERLKTSPARLSRDLYVLARSANLTDAQLRRCRRAVGRFWAGEVVRSSRRRFADTIHREFPGLAASLLDLRSRFRAQSGGSWSRLER